MMKTARYLARTAWFLTAAALLCLAAVSGPAQGADMRKAGFQPATAETVAALRQGGYTLYFRHGATETSRPDRVPTVDLDDCMTQRPLSDEGRRQAARVGEAIRALQIPLAEVLASPFCRTRETAQLAFGGFTVEPMLMATSNATSEEIAPLVQGFRALLGRVAPPGSNRMLVAHSTLLKDAVDIFPHPEGVVLIFRADGKGGFLPVAAIAPADWDDLLARK